MAKHTSDDDPVTLSRGVHNRILDLVIDFAHEEVDRKRNPDAEVIRLRRLLERWLRVADRGVFRDAAGLSLKAVNVADDTRDALTIS